MSPTRLSLLPDHHPKGSEEFDVPLDIEVTRASKSAIEAIEKAGGTVTCVHHNRLGLRALLAPEKFEGRLPKMAKPPPKLSWTSRHSMRLLKMYVDLLFLI